MATLSTLAARLPECVVCSDELNHASMIEGIRHSRAEKHIFRHNNPEDLDRLLSVTAPNSSLSNQSIRWMVTSHLSPVHSGSNFDHLIAALTEVWARFGRPPAA